jgi:hypothetical protein
MSSRYGHEVLERIHSTPSGMYYTYIKPIPYVAYKVRHSRLGHPGIGMMQKIIENYTGHDLKDAKILKSNDFVCTSCAM